MADDNSGSKGFVQKIKSLFSKNEEKSKSNSDELNNLLKAFKAATPKNESIVKTAGVKDIIRKHTAFGIARINGRNLEIDCFDIRLIDTLKRFKIIPLYANNSENTIAGFYLININTLKVSNLNVISLNGKDVHVCTLSALIMREVDKEAIREEDKLTIDAICHFVDEALKK